MMESGRKKGRERRGKRVNIVERQTYQKTSFHSILLHISRFFCKSTIFRNLYAIKDSMDVVKCSLLIQNGTYLENQYSYNILISLTFIVINLQYCRHWLIPFFIKLDFLISCLFSLFCKETLAPLMN